MPECRRFLAVAQAKKGRAFVRKAVNERCPRRVDDQPDGLSRSRLAARLAKHLAGCRIDCGTVLWWDREFAGAARWLSNEFHNKRLRACQWVGIGAVDEAKRQSFVCLDDPAGADQIDGGEGADQARQALRAAGSRHNAKLNLRQAEAGLYAGDATVAGKDDLAAATECCTIDSSDHRLLEPFDAFDDIGQKRLDRRLAEFLDISTTHESAAGARKRNADDGRICLGMIECSH
jgi:hypothetical protein